ncbi:MAG: long-chain fatty acid--CoA ligase [Nevskia sp.]
MSEATTTGIDPTGLAESFRRRAHRAEHRPALSYGETTWSYAEMQRRIERLSAVFADGGLQRGDRIGYLGFNHPDILVALFAAARLGAIFVPLNFRLSSRELQQIIDDAGLHTLLADATHQPLIDAVRGSLGCRRYVLAEDEGEATSHWRSLPALLAEAGETPPAVDGAPGEVVLLIYTSGTTGRPKGAMLTNGNLWTNNLNWILANDFTSKDVTLNSAPLFHVGGLCVVLAPTLLAGGHVVLQRSFGALEFIRDVERYKVTVSFAVPAMMLFASQHETFAEADLSSLRLIVAGGAPVPEPLLRLYAERGIPVSQCYGMTEATSGVTFLETDRALSKLGSCGRAGMLSEVKLIDFDGAPITEPGIPGEICLRGGNVIPGYWKMPDVSAAARDADGWFKSGDVAYVDAEGYYFICDRLKDMIISGGENIYPAEIESLVYAHPAVAEVAVIGAPDERWGERVVVVARLKPGASLTLDALLDFLAGRLARYKLPRELHLVEAMPRNPNGKVIKTELRRLYGAATNKH